MKTVEGFLGKFSKDDEELYCFYDLIGDALESFTHSESLHEELANEVPSHQPLNGFLPPNNLER